MKFLVDENLPLSYAKLLTSLGYSASHVIEVGLSETDDTLIVDFARKNQLVIITFDLDFSRIIALGDFDSPSVITFRMDTMTIEKFSTIVEQHLPQLAKSLNDGSMITITDQQIRVKKLPIRKK